MTDIQVIQRVTDILNAFAVDVPEVRLGPLSRDLGVQRSTLHRYLTSMANAGLLSRAHDGGYRLGIVAGRIGTLALSVGIDSEAIFRVMNEVCAAARLTVVRSVWNELAPVVVQTASPDTVTHVAVKIGTRLPFSSAQMLVFLAFDREGERRDQILSLLPAGDRTAIEAEIELIGSRGIAIGGRVSDGVRALAVPILGSDGAVVSALALIGTTVSVSDSAYSREARLLVRAADQLSALSGFAGIHPGTEFLDDEGLHAV